MEYFFVGLGGACGSLLRYYLGRFITSKSNSSFPLGTFIINITGAILLGIFNSISMDKNISILICDGFLGAYTTFSTFIYEGFNLFNNKKTNALVYIIISLFLGVLGYLFGIKIFKII
ncbi:MAG: fluoride efflux transporter CrcB [Clostridiales bacterium]